VAVLEDSAIGNLDEVENLENRSRFGGARLNVCSKAQRRIPWLGFMSKGDFWKLTRILGIFRDLFWRRI
jgi:hypothetical protein